VAGIGRAQAHLYDRAEMAMQGGSQQSGGSGVLRPRGSMWMKLAGVAAFVLGCAVYGGSQQPAQQAPVRQRPLPIDFEDHAGWKQIFDGRSLDGWDGNPDVWRVQDGAIVGQYKSPRGTRDGQTFLILKDMQPADFELKLEIKLEGDGADSGIQYRSYLAPVTTHPGAAPPAQDPRWNLGGYQFDFNLINTYTGQVAEGGPAGRGIISYRGQMVRTEEGKLPRLLADLGSAEALGGYFKFNDWNEVHLIARGNELVQMINGHVMAILVDDDATKAKANGLIGLQCAGNGPVRISFRNVWLKEIH
jgi:hypothetical protein